MADGKNETIVDRVVSRLKAQPLGDLITEEDLHDIVKEAIPKTFFAERREPGCSSYDRDTVKEPVIVEVMRELMRETVRAAVATWIKDNPEQIAVYWKQVSDAGLIKYVEEMQSAMATDALRTVLRSTFQALNEDRQRQGLMPLGFF